LGVLNGLYSSSVGFITPNGYSFYVNLDGKFSPSQIWWTSATGCTGTAILNDGAGGGGGSTTYAKTAVFSVYANAVMVTGTGTGILTSTGDGSSDHSIENAGLLYNGSSSPDPSGSSDCTDHNGANGYGGWTLTSLGSASNTDSTLGWAAGTTLTNCSVQIQFESCTSTTCSNGSITTQNNTMCVAGPIQLP
jgi:hypothetical protein